MLNELKEYEQYTVLPVSPEESRLRYDNFIKAKLSEGKTLFPGGPLSGLERVMTIVARYHLFNLGLEETKSINPIFNLVFILVTVVII